MNGIDTIVNVNPAQQPAGAMNPDVAMGAIRSRVFAQGTDMARQQSGRTLRRLFGPTSLSSSVSMTLLAVRVAFGGWCMYEGASAIIDGGLSFFSIMMVFAGIMIGAGLFARLTAAGAGVISAYLLCSALSEGMPAIEPGLLTAAFAAMAFAGPGRFSFDSTLRRNIFRSLSRRQMQRLLDNRFSYRAYEFAQYN